MRNARRPPHRRTRDLPVIGLSMKNDVELLVVDSVSNRRLITSNGENPSVSVPGGAAIDPPSGLVEAVRSRWGFDAALIRVKSPNIAEVEYIRGTHEGLSETLCWTPAWEETTDTTRPRWQRPGWFRSIVPSLDEELSTIGSDRTGPPIQVRHTSVTGLLRIPTKTGYVWLKEGLPIFAHEADVLRLLRRIGIRDVPEVLGTGDAWWIGAAFPTAGNPETGHFLPSMGRIQIASIPYTEDLGNLGCPRRPLSGLSKSLKDISEREDLLSNRERRELNSVLFDLDRVCSIVDAQGIPSTIVHGDLNRENVLFTGSEWFVYDWTDTCISHPFVDVALAVQGEEIDIRTRALTDYATTWAAVVPSERIVTALEYADVIGAAHQIVTYQWILDSVDRSAADVSGADQLLGLLRKWVARLVNSDRISLKPS